MKKLLLTLLTMSMSQWLVGEATASREKSDTPSWYQVDVVVFLNKASMNGQEAWPKVSSYTFPKNAVTLKPLPETVLTQPETGGEGATDTLMQPYVELPYNQRVLNKDSRLLSEQGQYKVLDQVSWRMPLSEEGRSFPVRVYAYNDAVQPSLLEGTITLSSGRYFHASVNLWYSELSKVPLAATGSSFAYQKDARASDTLSDLGKIIDVKGQGSMKVSRNFHLNQQRRMTGSGQIQYLDSPVIGVLLKLTPYQIPQPEVQATPSPVDETKVQAVDSGRSAQ